MSTDVHTMPAVDAAAVRAGRGSWVLIGTVGFGIAAAGAGMLEGHAVYPSWREHLFAFDGFAAYHAAYGDALLPWLPLPLALATLLNAWLVVQRPVGVPRWAAIATLAGNVLVVAITGALAIPIQVELATAGRSPAEIVVLVDRLITVNGWREVLGLATVVGYLVMLRGALRGVR